MVSGPLSQSHLPVRLSDPGPRLGLGLVVHLLVAPLTEIDCSERHGLVLSAIGSWFGRLKMEQLSITVCVGANTTGEDGS